MNNPSTHVADDMKKIDFSDKGQVSMAISWQFLIFELPYLLILIEDEDWSNLGEIKLSLFETTYKMFVDQLDGDEESLGYIRAAIKDLRGRLFDVVVPLIQSHMVRQGNRKTAPAKKRKGFGDL